MKAIRFNRESSILFFLMVLLMFKRRVGSWQSTMRITVVHGAEHVTSLFFKDVYTNVSPVRCNSSQTNCAAVLILFCQSLFKALSNFGKWLQNVFRSCRHVPMAMLRKYSKAHNRGIFIGFIKSLEYRMAGNTLLYAVSCV